MYYFLFAILLLQTFAYKHIGTCKPICKNNVFFNTTNQIMNELEYSVSNEIKILELELKMVIIARTIEFQKQIDREFLELTTRHKEQSDKYVSLLAGVGLSPAREDEIHKIVEMEEAARNGIIESIYD
jgi:hypothetical protein